MNYRGRGFCRLFFTATFDGTIPGGPTGYSLRRDIQTLPFLPVGPN